MCPDSLRAEADSLNQPQRSRTRLDRCCRFARTSDLTFEPFKQEVSNNEEQES